MKAKFLHVSYIILILLLMIIPTCTMNTKKEQISIIDNSYLPELPSLSDGLEIPKKLEEYVNKRIGFREPAIGIWENGMAVTFKELELSGCMFGKDGHIMGCVDYYIKDYQHANLEESREIVDSFTQYLSDVNEYLNQQNITFLFLLAPDKKTIYSDMYPDNTIGRYGDFSKTDMLLNRLVELQVPYVYPRDRFLEAKQSSQIYNKRYDVYHWNDLGNLLGNQIVDEQLRATHKNIVPLSADMYNLNYECRDRIAQSCYYIYEDVPVYYLKTEDGIINLSEQDTFLKENCTNILEHYVNENLSNAPKILILHDSYFAGSMKFYKNRYHEVISVHCENYLKIQELVEHYEPDIVLWENVERVLRPNPPFYDTDALISWEKSICNAQQLK